MSGIQALAVYGISDAESDDEAIKGDDKEMSPIVSEKKGDKSEEEDIVDAENDTEISEDSPMQNDKTYDISDTEVDHTMDESQIKSIEDMSKADKEEKVCDENNEDEAELDSTEILKQAAKRQKRMSSENATALSKKIRASSIDEIVVPPAPEGKCSKHLQDKITNLYEKKLKHGYDLNDIFQKRKDLRNPSIYEKLIDYLGIEELGTNFSPEDYNPNKYRKYPAYDELARAQREDIARKEKDKKTKVEKKVEYVTAKVKKSQLTTEASRKSKWDQQIRSSSVTGTSSTTMIPATGSLKKSK